MDHDADRGLRRTWGDWLFLLRNWITPLPILLALVCTRGEWQNEAGAWSIAIFLAVAGVSLRAWAVCHCNYGQHRPRTLTTTGPYAYVRNPLYIGNILIAAGATVASGIEWLVPVSVLWAFLTYAAVARFEEQRMLEKFGDAYRAYRDRVPAWIPALQPRSGADSASSYARALAIQSVRLAWLVPFLFKHWKLFGLGRW